MKTELKTQYPIFIEEKLNGSSKKQLVFQLPRITAEGRKAEKSLKRFMKISLKTALKAQYPIFIERKAEWVKEKLVSFQIAQTNSRRQLKAERNTKNNVFIVKSKMSNICQAGGALFSKTSPFLQHFGQMLKKRRLAQS